MRSSRTRSRRIPTRRCWRASPSDGIGAEVVGPVELALALRAGIPPDRIVVNGAGQTDDDLRAALASGALVNAESLDALRALLAADRGGRIGLRLNPGLDAEDAPASRHRLCRLEVRHRDGRAGSGRRPAPRRRRAAGIGRRAHRLRDRRSGAVRAARSPAAPGCRRAPRGADRPRRRLHRRRATQWASEVLPHPSARRG